jgi:hypothetical protein
MDKAPVEDGILSLEVIENGQYVHGSDQAGTRLVDRVD